MPIHLPHPTRKISQDEFRDIAYEVTGRAFDIHEEFGRFCDESVYLNELKARIETLRTEVPVTVTHGDFSKQYFLDAFVGEGGLFELKCVDRIHPKHRAQLMHYLLLTGLWHGKLINFRPAIVEHEFINCETDRDKLRQPTYDYCRWRRDDPTLSRLDKTLRGLIADWGTGLLCDLYTEAITHLIGRLVDVPVHGTCGVVGVKKVLLLDDKIGVKITALQTGLHDWRTNVCKWLNRTELQAIAWVNMSRGAVCFEVLHR